METSDHKPPPPAGSGRPVQSFNSFCEGDRDPTLNKSIHTLIDSQDDYIVYLDDELFVEYSWTEAYGETPDGFEEVASRLAHLETLSLIYIPRGQLEAFRRLLGEAMARIIGDKNGDKAQESLDTAQSYLVARGLERARIWYLQGSGIATAPAVLAAIALWLARDQMITHLGRSTFEVSVGALLGAAGSFKSIWLLPSRIHMDAGAGPSAHRFEGLARILIGMGCALAVALGIKANIVFGFTKSADHPVAYLLVICIAAGFSERLFLNLIGHVNDASLSGRKPGEDRRQRGKKQP